MDAYSREAGRMGGPAPAPIEALYATFHWLHERERWNDAAAVARGMVVLAPTDERTWLALGVCHEALGQTLVAAELFMAGAAACGASAKLSLATASAFERMGDLERAAAARDRATALALDTGDASVIDLLRDGGSFS